MFGGARRPNDQRTLSEHLVPSFCKNTAMACVRRAVTQRRTTARRGLRPSDNVRRNRLDFPCSHPQSFGSLAPPKTPSS